MRLLTKWTTCEEPALADGHENYSSDDVELPQFQELKKVANVARQAPRTVARENKILDDEGGHNVIHDLEVQLLHSESLQKAMGNWN